MVSTQNPRNTRFAMSLLIITTIIWGSTFIITKITIQSIPLFLYQAVRHGIAFLGFLPFLPRFRYLNKKILLAALITGGANFIMLTCQTIGLQTASAGKSAFITAMYVVITPILALIILKTRIRLVQLIAVGMAVVGLIILVLLNNDEIGNNSGFSTGDLLTLICAFFAAIQIVFTEKYVKNVDVVLFSMLQILVVAIGMSVLTLISHEEFNFASSTITNWTAWIYMGLCATTIPFFCQNWGQQYVESTRAAIVFTMEPVFATLFGVLFGSELLTWQFILGGGLIMGGILLSTIFIAFESNFNKLKKKM